MADFTLNIAGEETRVVVRPGILSSVGSLWKECVGDATASVLVVTDEQVGPLYADTVRRSLANGGQTTAEYRIEPGERSKSLAVAKKLYERLAELEIGRDGLILALGGGVVSDLAGFIAATWMRGVRFAICPTTLEADIDASLGGKTAINLPAGKNLVGAFHQPTLVAVDPLCLTTLNARDVCAGMAESIKHALLSSAEFFAWHEDHVTQILDRDETRMTELIERNLRIKGDVVKRDACERTGERLLLNLGHTIGHAVESCSAYSLRHGECVSLGLLAACRLSFSAGLLKQPVVRRVEELLKAFGLPTTLDNPPDRDHILAAVRRDKKVRGGRVQFVLVEDIGRPVVRNDIGEAQISEAYESLLA